MFSITVTNLNAKSIANEISSFNHISITVKNLKGSIHFYRDIIGCKELPGGGLRTGKALSKGIGIKNAKLYNYKLKLPNSNVLIELINFKNKKEKEGNTSKIDRSGYTHFSIIVNDINKTYKKLKENGIKTISSPVTIKETNAKFFYAYDPEGNIIEIVQGE